MRTYIIRRLLLLVPTLFLVTIIVFAVVRMIPGDVIDAMMSEMPQLGSTVDRELIRHKLGLDVPVYVQYGRWIGGVLQGDLGVSLRGEQPITPKILARLPVTFELGGFALIIGLLISLPIGIYSAIRQNTIGDYAGRGIAVTVHLSPDLLDSDHGHDLPRSLVGMVPLGGADSFHGGPAR